LTKAASGVSILPIMRFSTLGPLAFMAIPPVVRAAGALGFALGVKQPDGNCKAQADYEADFDAISEKTGSTIVRVYAAGQCDTAREILPAAKAKGFRVVLGIWAYPEDSYQVDKAAIVDYSVGYEEQVYAVAVGSETLYRGEFTGAQLAEKISDMKAATPAFKVGTADSWNKFNDGTADAAIGVSDIL
jgi:glucan 1,3-beta-glucosidase